MKKFIILAAVVSTAFLSSCKKDYTCTCTTSGGTSVSAVIKDTKAKAKASCEKGTMAGVMTCAIK